MREKEVEKKGGKEDESPTMPLMLFRFYGINFKLTDYDKKMFSRKGYECKDLLQGRTGLPVVVSQKQDKNFPIWKVQYGFLCLVFPTYEDAMDFCRDRFTRLDGKAV